MKFEEHIKLNSKLTDKEDKIPQVPFDWVYFSLLQPKIKRKEKKRKATTMIFGYVKQPFYRSGKVKSSKNCWYK
jgi:hypothetical protein